MGGHLQDGRHQGVRDRTRSGPRWR
jgi:hypothetical protein